MKAQLDEQKEQVIELARVLDAKKGFNIMALDLRGHCQIADYFIIVEGNVEKHLEALADVMIEKAATYGLRPLFIEGKGADWLVIDFAGIMAHLMLPAAREHYKLEQVWQQGKLVDLGL